MKSASEIKEGLGKCVSTTPDCDGCPYQSKRIECYLDLMEDACRLIEDLEERVAIMMEGNIDAEKTVGERLPEGLQTL